MITVPCGQIVVLHIFVSFSLIIISAVICLIWLEILSRPSDIEDHFKHSETLQLLQIVIGFTYISVINSFFQSLQSKTALVAEIRTLYDRDSPLLDQKFVQKLIGDTSPDVGTDSWAHWEKQGIDAKWKQIFTRVIVQSESDHGQLFSFLGPWSALSVFYLVHPAVAYTNNEPSSIVWWMLIYCVSICILFSFLVTMWIVERGAHYSLLPKCFYKATIAHYMEEATKHLHTPDKRDQSSLRDQRVNIVVDRGLFSRHTKHLKL